MSQVDLLCPSGGELDPKVYGVIARGSHRQGVLFPDIDGISTPELQVAHARRKSDLSPEAEVGLYRFEARRYV